MCVGGYGHVSVDACTHAEVRGQAARALPVAFPLVGDGLTLLFPTRCGRLVGALGDSFPPFPMHPLVGVLGSQVGDLSLSVCIQSGDPNWVVLVKTITALPQRCVGKWQESSFAELGGNSSRRLVRLVRQELYPLSQLSGPWDLELLLFPWTDSTATSSWSQACSFGFLGYLLLLISSSSLLKTWLTCSLTPPPLSIAGMIIHCCLPISY